MIKKIIIFILVIAMITTIFAACGNSAKNAGDDGKISIVTTLFPQYDWVSCILGDQTDDIDLTLLVDSGIDLHSFQPSVSDIAKISECDMFVYVGGESDEWIEAALENASNDNMVVISLLEVLGDNAKEEEIIEGMEDEYESHNDGADEHEAEIDEHVWLSLKNVRIFCDLIAAEIGKLDPANSDLYSANADAYDILLAELDSKYENTISGATCDTLLFGDRFPFRYLTDDYGLGYYAAFPGCSAETEAAFETIVFLANKLDEYDLNHVMVIENSDQSIAKTIIMNSGNTERSILVLDSIQSITSADIETGITYLSIMEDNLAVLTQALN